MAWDPPGGPERLNVFYMGGNGNLIENWFDGNSWNVTDHGRLPILGQGYLRSSAWNPWNLHGMPSRLNVFYRGGNGNLVENWFDGNPGT